MSKAEDRAQAFYPAWKNGIGDEFSQNSACYGFIEGYHQAEKDLERTVAHLARVHGVDQNAIWSEIVHSFVGGK